MTLFLGLLPYIAPDSLTTIIVNYCSNANFVAWSGDFLESAPVANLNHDIVMILRRVQSYLTFEIYWFEFMTGNNSVHESTHG